MRAAKAIIAALGALIMVLTTALADDVFDANEVGTAVTVIIESIIMVIAVFRVPNAGFVEVGKNQTPRQ